MLFKHWMSFEKSFVNFPALQRTFSMTKYGITFLITVFAFRAKLVLVLHFSWIGFTFRIFQRRTVTRVAVTLSILVGMITFVTIL